MQCPKCKKEIPEKSVKCDFCNAKLATFCKKCSAYNSIYNLRCVNCNNELLKVCQSCKSINLVDSIKCRKCGFFLKKDKELSHEIEESAVEEENVISEPQKLQDEQELETSAQPQPEPIEEQAPSEEIFLNSTPTLHSQQMAKDLLKQAFLSNDKKIISLNGEKGVGKTIVLKSAISEIERNEKIWLLGECSPITQLSPCGLIQDVLLSFFNIPNFCTDNLKLKKDSQRFFQSEFPTLSNEEIFSLLNFLYPTNSDYFENIFHNKEKTFAFLKKVFQTIISANQTVVIIENFDYIDGLSYEFLHNLLNSEFGASQLKFLITYNETRPVQGYLYSSRLKNNAYFDISISPLDKNQIITLVDRQFEHQACPGRIKQNIFDYSAGNPSIAEQYLGLVNDFRTANNSFDIKLPSTLAEVLSLRLDFLKTNPSAYRMLLLSVIQGVKFSPVIANHVLGLDEESILRNLTMLQELNFIIPVNSNFYAFKNTLLWSELLEAVKQEKEFELFNRNLFEVYSNYTLSSHSIIAVIAQNLGDNLRALKLWTDNIKIAAALGDTNLYAISQKQCLVLLDKINDFESQNLDANLIRNNIFERLGKMLSKSNPQEAMEYLPNAIKNANNTGNTLKEIELTGYLAQCCKLLGNYHGSIECIESVIERIDLEFDLEIAMLKSRKLSPLLSIGNCGEIIQLADNEILPIFEKYLNAKPHKNITRKALYKSWLQTYLNLASALVLQGNNRAFEIANALFEMIEKNDVQDKLFICNTKLVLAMANTAKGDIESSEEILEEILKAYRTDVMDNDAICLWNMINILNTFAKRNYEDLKEELFQVVTFANNIGDNFTKNILKALLGKLLKDEQNAKQALDIFSQQITYFSKEKNAIGALLSWYLIADAKLITDGPSQSLEVAQKALEVAQSPKINNYFFSVLYNKVIAEAYIIQGEYEMAKVFIEKGILIARKFELLSLLADLYLLYGKYLQDLALVQTEAREDYVLGASKMYKKAILISQGIKNQHLIAVADKARTVLNSFCQLNGITLKEG